MPRLVPGLALALLATSLPIAARGQAAATPNGSCSTALEVVPNAFSTDTLFLSVDPGYGLKPVDTTLALTALSVVNDDLVLPAPLAMPPVITKWYGMPADNPAARSMTGAQGFMAESFIEMARDGKVKRIGLTQSSLVPGIDAALVAAVTKAAGEGAFMGYQDAAHGLGGFVFVQLRTMPLPLFKEKPADYQHAASLNLLPIPNTGQSRVKPKGAAVEFPIRVLHVPLVRLSSPLTITKARPAPVFPRDELNSGQDGFVNVEFVVGPDSVITPGTLRVANGMTAGFAKAVVRSLDGYRFKPAMVGGCPVAARETWTFTFGVR